MAPIISALISNGLGILAHAVLAKGQDVIEEKLGVSLDNTPPHILREKEIEHEEFLVNAAIKQKEQEIESEKIAQGAVSERWKSDMLSDSWLSKNIRPMVLLLLLTTYFLFALLSAFNVMVTESYVELLAQMLMLVMGAYFLGRTGEKIVDMREKGKQKP
jgi:hypothetical protein